MGTQTPQEALSAIDRDIEWIREELKILDGIKHNPRASAKKVLEAERNALIMMSMLSDLMFQRRYNLEQIGQTE